MYLLFGDTKGRTYLLPVLHSAYIAGGSQYLFFSPNYMSQQRVWVTKVHDFSLNIVWASYDSRLFILLTIYGFRLDHRS